MLFIHGILTEEQMKERDAAVIMYRNRLCCCTESKSYYIFHPIFTVSLFSSSFYNKDIGKSRRSQDVFFDSCQMQGDEWTFHFARLFVNIHIEEEETNERQSISKGKSRR